MPKLGMAVCNYDTCTAQTHAESDARRVHRVHVYDEDDGFWAVNRSIRLHHGLTVYHLFERAVCNGIHGNSSIIAERSKANNRVQWGPNLS